MPDPNVPQTYEERPDVQKLTGGDYEPHPERSIKLEPERQKIVDAITSLYSSSCADRAQGEKDMMVYAEKAIYDDPWSYCDTRYKIAGQWYGAYSSPCPDGPTVQETNALTVSKGIPKVFSSTRTLATEVVSSTTNPNEIIYKQKQEYTPRLLNKPFPKNSLITLTLDENNKVKYHKDQWNEKDYSHEGLGKIMKTLNGDQLTHITRPPDSL